MFFFRICKFEFLANFLNFLALTFKTKSTVLDGFFPCLAQIIPSMRGCVAYTVDSRYLAPVGSQNLRARVKWFSRYLALSREGHNSRLPGSQTHIPAYMTYSGVYKSQNSMLSDNKVTYVSRISTHIDLTPATNHNKQH